MKTDSLQTLKKLLTPKTVYDPKDTNVKKFIIDLIHNTTDDTIDMECSYSIDNILKSTIESIYYRSILLLLCSIGTEHIIEDEKNGFEKKNNFLGIKKLKKFQPMKTYLYTELEEKEDDNYEKKYTLIVKLKIKI